MAFATVQNVGDRLGRPLTTGEQTSVELLIELATAGIVDALDKDDAWAAALTPVPKVIEGVCIEAAARALANPNSLKSLQEQLGQHNYTATFRDDAGIYLTDFERRLVRRAVYGPGIGSVQVGSALDISEDTL